MFYCQLIVALLQVWGFLLIVKGDFEGRPARKASGFFGFIVTVVLTAAIVAVYYHAGVYSQLIK